MNRSMVLSGVAGVSLSVFIAAGDPALGAAVMFSHAILFLSCIRYSRKDRDLNRNRMRQIRKEQETRDRAVRDEINGIRLERALEGERRRSLEEALEESAELLERYRSERRRMVNVAAREGYLKQARDMRWTDPDDICKRALG
jgi:hypothetical protein